MQEPDSVPARSYQGQGQAYEGFGRLWKLTRDLDDYGADEIRDLSEMEPEKEDRLTFEQVFETLPIKERNRYLELETRCAVIGKFIHPDGEYSEARKHFTDRMLSPKEVRENGKDTLV